MRPYKWRMTQYCSLECAHKSRRGVKFTDEHKRKIAVAHIGIPPWNKGLVGYNAGSKHPNWKGGITPINQKERKTGKYSDWRKKVFQRDNYTCQECGQFGGWLNADHIKPFAYFPELRFDVDNGRTLCRECHKKTDTFAGRCNVLAT